MQPLQYTVEGEVLILHQIKQRLAHSHPKVAPKISDKLLQKRLRKRSLVTWDYLAEDPRAAMLRARRISHSRLSLSK